MAYLTRSKKLMGEGGPAGDMGNELIKQKPKVDKPYVPHRLFATELGYINHNLDVFTLNIEEWARKFNEKTIFLFDIGNRMTANPSNNEYRIVCKIGFGGFSVVWLVIDRKSKEFKVAKVFRYDHGISKLEKKILHQTSNHPNILHFYEELLINSCNVGIYEPLGKDLNNLMKEASKHGGLSISVVKKVAKHVLLAVKTIHDLNIVHSDIKLQNIATCVSQQSLRCELEKIVKSGKSLSLLRMMVCQKNTEFDENEVRNSLKEELNGIPKVDNNESSELIFKLIDFGNAIEHGTESETGTFGFHPPEYFFGAPLLPSYDIWALGVTIFVLLTDKMFLDFGLGKVDIIGDNEITALRNMFGKFCRRRFKDFKAFKDPDGFKKKFNIKLADGYKEIYTTKKYDSKKVAKQIKKFLQTKFNKLRMLKSEKKDLVDFLFHMLNTIPTKRKSAEELLSHPWLNKIRTKSRRNRNEQNLNFNASKSQEQKETSAIGTPFAASSSSSSCDISGISLDDLSINEQLKFKNDIKIIPSFVPKHLKNNDTFIYKNENGTFFLYHKGWQFSWKQNSNYFVCPVCFHYFRVDSNLPPKVKFIPTMNIPGYYHRYNCIVKKRGATKKHQNEVISFEEVDRRRQSLLDHGIMLKHFNDDAICQQEAENHEGDNEADSKESDDETDSSTYESEDDSNKTISEFGSGESYFEEDAIFDPHVDSLKDEELKDGEWFNI